MNAPALVPRLTIRLEQTPPRVSKIAQARQAFSYGDYRVALRIVSGFRSNITQAEARVFKSGYEALVHPGFYKQLGRDPGAMVAAAVALFRSKYVQEA